MNYRAIFCFVGKGRAPYKLFWDLRYYEYEAIQGCVAGPKRNGGYNCGGGTGHKAVVGYKWEQHSDGGEIPPSTVQNLPASVMADINNDGTPDAYWDNNLTLRRMDDNNRVDNPRYQRSWNWAGSFTGPFVRDRDRLDGRNNERGQSIFKDLGSNDQ